VAHELARGEDLALRRAVGDPFDLGRRTVIPAASVLTIRNSQRTDGPTIVLHHRDAARVAHGGGLHQVVPVGVFQPTSDDPTAWTGDFDLWRSIVRECSEELLGTPEIGRDGPVDYERWPFHQALAGARDAGDLRVFWLGLGMDPLSLVTDFLIAAVFEDQLFDHLFGPGELVAANAEGEVLAGVPLSATHSATHPMQPAGAALLHLADTHRDLLLARS
jgi:hypothetical protein